MFEKSTDNKFTGMKINFFRIPVIITRIKIKTLKYTTLKSRMFLKILTPIRKSAEQNYDLSIFCYRAIPSPREIADSILIV